MPKVSDEYFEQKRVEIVDAAYKVALRKSVSSITLKDLWEEADMARGAIYRYYDSLEEILADLVIRINSDNGYYDEIDKIFDKADKVTPEKTVKSVCDFLYGYLTSCEMDVHTLSIQFDVFCIHEPERVKKIMEIIGDRHVNSGLYFMDKFEKYIRKETKNGRMKPLMNSQRLIDFFMSSFKGIELQYTLGSVMGPLEKNEIKASMKALYLTMINLLGCN